MTRFLRILMLSAVAAALLAAPASAYKVARTPAPPEGVVGVSYSYTFTAEGGTGPHSFHVDSGAAPPGLTLAASGAMTGVPTQAGSFKFFVEAVDANVSRSQVEFTINIIAKITLTTSFLPDATAGTPYFQTLSATGASSTAYTITEGTLPAGLTLSDSGVISGVPMGVGTSTFTVSVTDGTKAATKTLKITVLKPLTLSAAAFPPAIVGRPFTAQLSSGGGSGSMSFFVSGGALPSGLVLDPADGVISGTPKTPGTFPVEIAVSASNGQSARSTLNIVVLRELAFVTRALPPAKLGRSYRAQLIWRGGVKPVMLSSTSIFPPGIVLDAESGLLTGRPKARGVFRMVVTAKDSYGGTTARRFTIVVRR